MVEKKKKIQKLVFDKKQFPTKRKIREWIKTNNYTILQYKRDPIHKLGDYYHVRQREPWHFNKATLRSHKIYINRKAIKGVMGVSGFLK
jgi:hypothetical protein